MIVSKLAVNILPIIFKSLRLTLHFNLFILIYLSNTQLLDKNYSCMLITLTELLSSYRILKNFLKLLQMTTACYQYFRISFCLWDVQRRFLNPELMVQCVKRAQQKLLWKHLGWICERLLHVCITCVSCVCVLVYMAYQR